MNSRVYFGVNKTLILAVVCNVSANGVLQGI